MLHKRSHKSCLGISDLAIELYVIVEIIVVAVFVLLWLGFQLFLGPRLGVPT